MKTEMNYQHSMAEIENIIKTLEGNNPDIDDMMKSIKRASELIKYCKEKLKTTEIELNDVL